MIAATALLASKPVPLRLPECFKAPVQPGLRRGRVRRSPGQDRVRLAHIDVDVRVACGGDSPMHMNSLTPIQISGTPRSFLNFG